MGWRKKITLTERWRQATGCIRERARRKGWELRDTVGEPSEVKSTYYKQISSKHPQKIPSSQLVLQERLIQNEVYRIGFNWEQRARNQSSIQDDQGAGGYWLLWPLLASFSSKPMHLSCTWEEYVIM